MANLSGDSGHGRRAGPDNSADPRRDELPVLPSITRDESAEAWGERAPVESEDERFLRERPPHHEG